MSKEIEFQVPINKRDKITVLYDSSIKKEIVGIATDGDAKDGMYFPVVVKHRAFELKLLMIEWEDGLREIHPQFKSGGDHFKTLHGRLRLTISPITSGKYRGKFTVAIRKALLRKGITPHANLFDSTFEDLDKLAGFDTEQYLYDFGAIDVGSKELVFGDDGRSRFQNCAVFTSKNYSIPILVFIFARVIPIYRKKHVPA